MNAYPGGPGAAVSESEVAIPTASGARVFGTLARPQHARGLVIFAHGSGSSRFSARNRFVASALNEAGFATLLMDLLTAAEERVDELTREHRFDIGLLAGRLVEAIDEARRWTATRDLPIGLFGASTGAAAAIAAAAERPREVFAVVSRGGRPDLAGAALNEVRAPSLFIVGGADREVLELNRGAMTRMRATVALEIVPGASHLFEEPGALQRVAVLARAWFERRLPASPAEQGAC